MSIWRNRESERINEEAGVPEVQSLLREMNSGRTEPGPFFTKRVMAAIVAQEADFTRRARAWAAIPTFASRLSAIAALLLIVAGTWLFTGTSRQSILANGIFEDSAAQASSTSQDDVFVVPGEDGR
jgi:hypothetical protein